MEQNPIGSDARMARRTRQVGPGAKCALCDERDARALVARAGLCYECLAAKRGRSRTEKHHFPNEDNSLFTVMIPGNEHRILNHQQLDWPRKTFRNPHGSPLLKASAAMRGWLDVLRLIIDRVGWIPALLEDLDGWLEKRLGPEWWRHIPKRET